MEEGKGETVQRTGIPGLPPSPDSSDGEVDRLEELREEVERLHRQVALEKERREQTASELGRRAVENRRLASSLAEARSGIQGSTLEENEMLKSELRKWKNIARHINVELIEHDREVLNIMHQTSRTRLAWERDLALNRQGLFASKLNDQHKAVGKAVEETEQRLLLKFEEDLAPERKRREEAEAKARELADKLAHTERVFSEASQVNKALAQSQAEILEELERERAETASMTPKKMKQNAEKMRRRNKDLQLEIEDLKQETFEKDAKIRDLNRQLRERDEAGIAASESATSAGTQTDDGVTLLSETRLAELVQAEREKDDRIEGYKRELDIQAEQAEEQVASLKKQKSKVEKKLKKASKVIVHLEGKQAFSRAFLGWRAEVGKSKALQQQLEREAEDRRNQFKAGLLSTYFSMYHHRKFNARLLKHSFEIWRADSRSVLLWSRLLHKVSRKIHRARVQQLEASQLSLKTVSKALLIRKHSEKMGPRATIGRLALQQISFGLWKGKTAMAKLVRDVRGLKVAFRFLGVQMERERAKRLLNYWRLLGSARRSGPAAESHAAEEEGGAKEGSAPEEAFVDKTLSVKIGSDVTIKYNNAAEQESNPLKSILDKVQSILHDQLKDLKETVSGELNRMASSGTKSAHAIKHALQQRLLQVDMTCGKLLEGLLVIGQTLSFGKSDQGLQPLSPDTSRDEIQRVIGDLRQIKSQARQALTSLEGLDRRVVMKADTIPKRVVRLYEGGNPRGLDEVQASFKAPEWTHQMPAFLPIE